MKEYKKGKLNQDKKKSIKFKSKKEVILKDGSARDSKSPKG